MAYHARRIRRSTQLRVIIDKREEQSLIPARLRAMGVLTEMRMLDVGDYLVGNYAIERKTTQDLLSSLYSGRLFDQATRISEAYDATALIVEGDLEQMLTTLSNPKAFWGALISLSIKYGMKTFFTIDGEQTALFVYTFARQLTRTKGARQAIVVRKPRLERISDWQLLVVGSLPGIGPKIADRLLRTFGNVRNIFRAQVSELETRARIGRVRAQRIAHLLEANYGSGVAFKQSKLEYES